MNEQGLKIPQSGLGFVEEYTCRLSNSSERIRYKILIISNKKSDIKE